MMKNKTVLKLSVLAILAGAPGRSQADDYLLTLRQIVDHSTAVSTATALTAAQQDANLTGLTLENPEVEFSYQWGRPSSLTPDKKTLDVSQSFDPAVLSGAKSASARAANRELDAALSLTRTETAARVDALMTEAVWRARTAQWFDDALSEYAALRAGIEKSVQLGEMTVIDLNAVLIEEKTLRTEADLNRLELDALLSQLHRTARNINIRWTPRDYMDYRLPPDFDTWSREQEATDPELASARARLELAGRNVALAKREGLPQFSLGYTSEMVTEANYHGLSVGLSVPLWANKGRVKAAKAARSAAQIALDDAAYAYLAQLRMSYDKSTALRSLADDVRRLCRDCDITPALDKMLRTGKLPVHEYLLQLKGLRELDRKLIDAEHDYQTALVELRNGRVL